MQFRTTPEGFNSTRSRVITVMTIITIGVLSFVAGPGLFSGDPDQRITSLIMVALFGVVSVFTVIYTLRKQKEQHDSIVVTITDDSVIYESHVLPTMVMKANEIHQILMARDGSIMITGSIKARMPIPSHMQNGDQMIAMLSKFKPITKK